MNSLNMEVFDEFKTVFSDIQSDNNIKGAVILSAKPGSFIAGADIE